MSLRFFVLFYWLSLAPVSFAQQESIDLPFDWAIFETPSYISTSADRAYANAWVAKSSANPAPPATITASAQYTAGNYRLFNDFGHGTGGYNVGITPDPCGTGGFIPGWLTSGQPSQHMGATGISPSGETYQLSEGRVVLWGREDFRLSITDKRFLGYGA